MAWRLRDVLAGGIALSGARPCAYLALVALSALTAVWGARTLFEQLVLGASSPLVSLLQAEQGAPQSKATAGRVTLSQSEWHERIRSRDFWQGRRAGPPAPSYERERPEPRIQRPTSWQFERPVERERPDETGSGYRTVCVRLCDGYFWPVSFATSEAGFGRDQVQCERSCGSPARLYVYRNPSEEPAVMRTPDGQPYSSLPTAFRFRTKYDAQCKCTAQPWEKEAQDRHRVYALEEAHRKGDRTARQEIANLRTRQENDRRRIAQQRTLALASVRAGSLSARAPLPPLQVAAPVVAAVTLPAQPAPVRATAAARPARTIAADRAETPTRAVATAPSTDIVIMRLGVAPPTSESVGASGQRLRSQRRMP